MERIIKKDDFGDIACNDICIYSVNQKNVSRNIDEGIYTNWKIIEPKYFRYGDDNAILEIWDNGKGILLSGNLKGFINDCWTTELREEITYKEAMLILDKEQKKKLMSRAITDNETSGLDAEDLIKKYNSCIIGVNYVNNDMIDAMSYTIGGIKEQFKQKDYILEDDKQNNNGGASDWYSLPKDANTLQDLIEHRNMNGSVKDIFKACYRLGIKTEDELRDLNKMAYYSLREIGRITGRRDYITIAKELMGEQAIENQPNKN